ncbi:hypothetical protein ACKQTC_07915 [Peptococcus simiae]|uniref:Uncharacterized protein n=1 Tax=Peptococcus simiae TaxID=1643805 RepID=A0ABW9H1T7_9FIRM
MRRLPYLFLVLILAALGSILAFRLNQAGPFPASPLTFIGGTGAILLACTGSGVCARRAFGPPVAGRPVWAILLYAVLVLHLGLLALPVGFPGSTYARLAESYFRLTLQVKPVLYLLAYTAGWLTGPVVDRPPAKKA